MIKTNSKLNKILATSALVVGGFTIISVGSGMVHNVSAANTTTSETSQNGDKGSRPQLTDAQKQALDALRTKAIAQLSSEDQATLKTLEAKGHFVLTYTERSQLDAIQEKVMTYMEANWPSDVEKPNTPKKDSANKPDSTLTDAQKQELDKLKAEGIAQLTPTEQARLIELDAKGKASISDADRQELRTIIDKVMSYVKSKASFTLPEPGKGGQRG